MIWAQANNGVIGKQGSIPWHLPEDLQFFKKQTEKCAVIMGRKTWESIPSKFKPLSDRQNIVITSDPTYIAVGAETVLSPEAALLVVKPGAFAWVIGGQSIYESFINTAVVLVVTEIDIDVLGGDSFSPYIDTKYFWKAPVERLITPGGEIKYYRATYIRTNLTKSQEALEKNENKLPE